MAALPQFEAAKEAVAKERETAVLQKAALAKESASRQTTLDRLRHERHDLLRRIQTSQLSLPLKAGASATVEGAGGAAGRRGGDKRGGGGRKGGRKAAVEDEDVEMSTAVTGAAGPASSLEGGELADGVEESDDRQVSRIDFDKLTLDTDGVSIAHESRANCGGPMCGSCSSLSGSVVAVYILAPPLQVSPEEVEETAQKLEAQAHEQELVMSRMAPNLKAAAMLEDVERKLAAEAAEVAAARTLQIEAEARLREVSHKRRTLFETAFTTVQGAIDAISKDLTVSASHPTGGTARLSLENAENLFDGA